MTPKRVWQYGFRASGTKVGHQLCLGYSTCQLADEYLIANCGGCNPGCDPSRAWISPSNPHLPQILENIGGLVFDSKGQGIGGMHLPRAVPLVWDNRATVPPDAEGPLAIRPGEIFRVQARAGSLRCTPNWDVRRSLGLPPDTELWLTPGAKDEVIEWMWKHPYEATSVLFANGLGLWMPSDFSVWGDDCPLTWKVNGKRSLVQYSEWLELGLPCVPTISLPNEFFANQWAEWVERNPAVNCLAVNCQMWRSDDEFAAMFGLLAEFSRMVRRDMHYIICGPVASGRIAQVQRTLSSYTIVSSAWYNAKRTTT